jgi:hypothetical protein
MDGAPLSWELAQECVGKLVITWQHANGFFILSLRNAQHLRNGFGSGHLGICGEETFHIGLRKLANP